eukprot:5435568-Amphidinium_carterae.1
MATRDRIMLITVNDEVSTVRMALHRLGLEVALMAAFVQRPGVDHLLQQSLGDIACIRTLMDLKGWLESEMHSHPRVDCALVCGLTRVSHDTLLMDQSVELVASDQDWSVQCLRIASTVSHGVCVCVCEWTLAPSWRSSSTEAVTWETQLEVPCKGPHTREEVECMEEQIGLHRHATGGLLPGHLQRQLHAEWLQARAMLVSEAVPAHVLLPALEDWATCQGLQKAKRSSAVLPPVTAWSSIAASLGESHI